MRSIITKQTRQLRNVPMLDPSCVAEDATTQTLLRLPPPPPFPFLRWCGMYVFVVFFIPGERLRNLRTSGTIMIYR